VNWDRVEGRWKQQRGKAAQQWGKRTKDELAKVSGRYIELVGNLQEHYGIARAKAKHQHDIQKNQYNTCRLKSAARLRKAAAKITELNKKLRTEKNARKQLLRTTSLASVKKHRPSVRSL
jgi:uncharacterized protein YjbJ (UPF0337 family)